VSNVIIRKRDGTKQKPKEENRRYERTIAKHENKIRAELAKNLLTSFGWQAGGVKLEFGNE
jgi:hypothetical protein